MRYEQRSGSKFEVGGGAPVTKALSQESLEQALLETAMEIANQRNRVEELKLGYARAEEKYRREKAKAFLLCNTALKEAGYEKPTETIRQAWVDVQTEIVREERGIADALSNAVSEKLRALYAELTAYQSLIKERQKERDFTNLEAQSATVHSGVRAASPTSAPRRPVPTEVRSGSHIEMAEESARSLISSAPTWEELNDEYQYEEGEEIGDDEEY